MFESFVPDEIEMQADDADHQRRHFVDPLTAQVDIIQPSIQFDCHLQKHEPYVGEIEDLVKNAAKVGKLSDGVPIYEGTEEIGEHSDLMAEHQENSLEGGEEAQDSEDFADDAGFLSWRDHPVKHSKIMISMH